MEFKKENPEWEIFMKTDSEIREIIARQSKCLRVVGHRLPDNGQKLEATLNRYVDELKRRYKQSSESHFGVATNDSAVGGTEHDSLTDGKMQKIVNELLNAGIFEIDVGKAAEVCYNDPIKVKVLFALPSHMRKSYVYGFLYPQI